MSFDAAFAERARQGGGMVPVTRQVVLDGDTPVTAFAKLHRGPYGFLLESLEGGERWARYTFLSTDPREVYRYRGRACERWTAGRRAGGRSRSTCRRWSTSAACCAAIRRWTVPGLPRFTGGAVGYLGYDVVRTIESLPDAPPDDRDLPDAVMMVTDTLLVLDNLYNRATVIANVEVAAEADARGAAAALCLGHGPDRRLGGASRRAGYDPAAGARAAGRPACGRVALPRRPVSGPRAPHQGVHRRRRHLSDGPVPPARRRPRPTRS